MKNVLLLLAVALPLLFVGCSKDDDPNFDYDVSILHGKWRITHAETDEYGYIDITKYPYSSVFTPTYATFNSNGTYSGEGYFGNGSGTYTAVGKTITCYIDKNVYAKYDVLSLSGQECELLMYAESASSGIKIKCKKQ